MNWVADLMNWFSELTRTDWLIIIFFAYFVFSNYERSRASWQRWKMLADHLGIHDSDIINEHQRPGWHIALAWAILFFFWWGASRIWDYLVGVS